MVTKKILEDKESGEPDEDFKQRPDLEMQVIGDYELLDIAMQGGHAELRLAENLKTGETVVVKYLRDDIAEICGNIMLAKFAEIFGKEARLLHWLDHPNIVKAHKWFFDDQGKIYTPMERLEKRAEAYILEKQEPRDRMKRLYNVMRQSAQGLSFLHDLFKVGIVLCDFKPYNLMVDKKGVTKMCDFGSAKLAGDEVDNTYYTPLFFPRPKELESIYLDSSIDHYSFGKTFTWMLLRMNGFSSEQTKGLMKERDGSDIDALQEKLVPSYLLNNVIGNCLDSIKEESTFTTRDLEAAIDTFGKTFQLKDAQPINIYTGRPFEAATPAPAY